MIKNFFLIIKLFFFFVFFTNSYAETISETETRTSSTNVTEDFTINSGVTLFFLNHQKGLRVKSGDITITNRGTLHSYEDDESSTNQTITGTGTDGAYDIKIYNYGTIYNTGTSAIFAPNNDQDNDGDGIGPYIYNEGTIKSSNKWTIRFHASDKTKIDNYGDIVADTTQEAILMYEDNDTIINNYPGGLISAAGSGAIATKTSDAQASNRSTINNWGTIQAEWDSVELGQNSILNNYGKIIVDNTSYSTRASIQLQNDNNTVNLFDGTVLVGIIDADTNSATGSTLNLDLCSSYYFKVTGTWSVNNKSNCGELAYSENFVESVSPLFQSVSDEIGALRTDIINDVYDFAKIKMENNESFALPLKSYSKRERGKSINKFASNINGFAFGYPSENDKIKGHLVFNFLDNSIDLLNQNIEDKTYQAGFFLENLNIKAIFGYHDYNGNRIRLNNLVAAGKEVVKANHKSFSSIIGTQFFTKLNDNSYLKYNLDSSFENFFNSEETSDHVTWKNRTLGQVMGDVTLGWSTLPKNKFKFNPELTLGYRTIIDGKNQKYNFNGYQKNFDGGVQEDFNSKIALLTDYSFKKNTNIHFDASAKKTNSKQETYSLNIGFKSKF